MKILFVLYNSKIGGAQKSLLDWATVLSTQNLFDIEVLFIQQASFKNECIKSFSLGETSIRNSVFKFISIVYKHKPDYVITTMYGTGLLLLLAKIILPFKFNYLYREATNIKKSRNLINQLLTFLIFIFSYKTSFNSLKQYKYYKLIFSNKLVFIPNCFFYTNAIVKKRNKAIIMVGRSNKVKQFELGIRAVMSNTDENMHIFTTSNDMTYVNELKSLIDKNNWNNRAKIHIDISKKNAIYSSGDVLLLTSKFEGSPNVLIEALSWHLGVISFDVEYGPSEIFDLLKIDGLTNSDEIFKNGILKKLIKNSRSIDKNKCCEILNEEYGPEVLKRNLN